MTVVPNEATNIDGGTKAAVQQESGRKLDNCLQRLLQKKRKQRSLWIQVSWFLRIQDQ